MSDCDGSSCSGRYEWGDGSTYDFLASGNMRVVQNERDPCFRLMVGDSQVRRCRDVCLGELELPIAKVK